MQLASVQQEVNCELRAVQSFLSIPSSSKDRLAGQHSRDQA